MDDQQIIDERVNGYLKALIDVQECLLAYLKSSETKIITTDDILTWMDLLETNVQNDTTDLANL